jgi:hypothetical protein
MSVLRGFRSVLQANACPEESRRQDRCCPCQKVRSPATGHNTAATAAAAAANSQSTPFRALKQYDADQKDSDQNMNDQQDSFHDPIIPGLMR